MAANPPQHNTKSEWQSTWHVHEVDLANKIVFIIDDANEHGGMTVTNDADNVMKYVMNTFGNSWRIVYKDTSDEWWEIVKSPPNRFILYDVAFKQWHGLEWDILSRK